MSSLLAQRVLHGSALTAIAVFCSRAWPVAQHGWTRKNATSKSSSKFRNLNTLSAVAPQKRGRPRTREQAEKNLKLSETPKDQPPPKRPPPIFSWFWAKYLKTHPTPRLGAASKAWRTLPPAEKQALSDEYNAAVRDWRKRRLEYYQSVDPALIRAPVKHHVPRGESRAANIATVIHDQAPAGAFARFLQEFRNDADFFAGGKERLFSATAELGERWRAMSDEERAPYYESFRAERDEYHARKAPEART